MEINAKVASKKMSQLKISSQNQACHINIVWCRIMYHQYEKKHTQMHRHSFYECHSLSKKDTERWPFSGIERKNAV